MSASYGRWLGCPDCGADTDVTDTRPWADEKAIKRRRKCKNGHRFTTVEMALPTKGLVLRPGHGGVPVQITPLADYAATVAKAAGDAVRRWLAD